MILYTRAALNHVMLQRHRVNDHSNFDVQFVGTTVVVDKKILVD